MGRSRLQLLGGFALYSGEERQIALPTRKDRMLLAYLALQGGAPQPRERLAHLLWAERAEAQARSSLRQSLAAIKVALAEAQVDALDASRGTVTFEPSGLNIDAVALDASRDRTELETVSLYRGELLEGIDAPTPEFDAWLAPERARFETLASRMLEQFSRQPLTVEEARAAIAVGHRLAARDKLNEPGSRALMRLYVRIGERTTAVKTFAHFRDALKEELGASPELETEQLYRDVLTGEPTQRSADGETTEVSDTRPRLAVLPFTNIGCDPQLSVLGEGLAEDIIIGLGRFRLLFVIDRHSSQAVSQQTTDAGEIGKRLGLNMLVLGSLRWLGDSIRISVQLVNTATRTQLWGDTFDAAAEEVLQVPDAITRSIVVKLQACVENSIIELSRRKPVLAAYECVLRGIKHLRGYGPDDNQRAIELFDKAVALDPGYALAQSYRAFADVVDQGYDTAPRSTLLQSRQAAEKALEMEPEDARCHWILGIIAYYCGDHAAQERHTLRAAALNPNDANVTATLGAIAASGGRAEEGIAQIRAAMRLNPYHPDWYWGSLCAALYNAGRYSEAMEAQRQRSPSVWSLARIAACQAELGQLDQARQTVAEVLRLKPDFSVTRYITSRFSSGMRKAGLPE